jgi:DNA-binding CsgD family transcriptional regulator/tetratricopeptide (TPR) repeat protein
VLVERDHLLASLTALVEQAAAGRGALVFLGGEAGVGKTSLSAALAGAAGGLLTVRRGGCDNVTTADALGPLIDAVPELTAVIEDEAELNRLRLFRRLTAVLTAAPTLLLLEDVHWADEATLEILRFLGRRIESMPLLVLATFREDEVVGGHPLTVVLGDLATAPGVRRMRLEPLTVAGVSRLIEAAGSPLDAEQVHSSTGGNAFYVTEVLATGEQTLPTSVRDAVLARASRLSPAARQVLTAAAVLGQRAELELLVAVSGQPAAAVDECVERGVLVGAGQALAFRHELARLAIEQTLSPAACTELHATALRALQVSDGGDHRRLAHHAAGSGDRDCVLLHAPRAGARAARLGAHREAAEQYRLALRFADADDVATRAQLLAALSYECYLTDQLPEAFTARLAAMQLSEQVGDTLAVGAAQRWLSRMAWFLGRNAESRRYAELAVATLEPLGDGLELALAYSNRSQLQMLCGDLTGAVSWGNRAVAMARRIGEQLPEIHALNNIGTALGLHGDLLEGGHRLARSLDLALASDAHEHAARAYTNLGSMAFRHRRLAEADRHLRAGIEHSTDRGLDSWRLYMSAMLACSLAEQGRYPDADEVVRQVLGKPQLAPTTRILVTSVAGQLAARRGEDPSGLLAEALELATPTNEAQRLVPVAAARAEAAWLAGRIGEIVPEVDRAWQAANSHPLPWDLGELSWWLQVAGVRRESPVPVTPAFALMLDGRWQAAADEWQALGCPMWAALALSALPELAAARQALELVDGIGAPATRQAILRDRHARGLAVPRGPRATSRANPSGLTGREIDVLQLLAGGLSNADVADQLFLSEKTVGHHVSSVLHKLGQPTRSRAVAAAIRQGIVTP